MLCIFAPYLYNVCVRLKINHYSAISCYVNIYKLRALYLYS